MPLKMIRFFSEIVHLIFMSTISLLAASMAPVSKHTLQFTSTLDFVHDEEHMRWRLQTTMNLSLPFCLLSAPLYGRDGLILDLLSMK